MRKIPFSSLAALTLCAVIGSPSLAAQGDSSGGPGMEKMQHWAADHEALLDAKLGGLKAGLKLTPDQEKLWTPFEAAVRDAAKSRMEHMKAMMDQMHGADGQKDDMQESGPAISPIDRLGALAQRMSERGAAIQKFVDAAKPFYASLDDSQKRLFSMLGGELLMMGHGHRHAGMMGGMGMGMMGGGMGMMGDHRRMREDGELGMKDHESQGMEMREMPGHDDEDNFDED